jgi:hypothetical protein
MAYTINLTHRGPQVISGFDLFDECHYGADKLYLRGHFDCPTAVNEQVKIALGGGSLDVAKLEEIYETEINDDFKKHKLGIGDPLTETPEDGDLTDVPTIALNRYYIPDKKFWNNTPPSGIANPYKASAAVTFSLRVYFRNDYAYINFGMPWAAVMDETKDEVATTVSLSVDEIIKNFRLLQCHFISKEDALQILNSIFEGFGTEVAQVNEVLDFFTDEGEAISS